MIDKEKIVKDVIKNIGLLDDKKIKTALEEQLKTKESLSNILVNLGYIANQNVGKTLIAQIGIIPVSVNIDEIEQTAVNLLPSSLAISHRIVALKYKNDKLFLGTDDPLNFLTADNIEKIINAPVDIGLIRSEDLDAALQKFYLTKKKEDVDFGKISENIKETKGGEDAPIIKLVNVIIDTAIKRRASDIHIEPLENKFRVRYRIDGVLHEMPGPPKRLQGAVISRIKIMAGMDIAEKRLPQDGRIKITINKQQIDLRVSNLPAIHGESVVMRILDKSNFLVGIEDLGFLPDQKKAFEKLINIPNGMFLITGPTGSGKTTTLYAVLSRINQKERKVITIEDPVEYQLDGINQVQVKSQIGLTFASGLRSMLRQAPDIIMVGEIRDLETAEISIQSALTGHLIFSTVHTNDSVSAITRLVNMGIKPYLVASTVQGVLAQRLVRTLCPSCREAHKITEEEMAAIGLTREQAGDMELYTAKGCPNCNNTGFKGRIGILELLVLNNELKEMILNEALTGDILKKAKEFGLRTLREDGFEKVKRGYTTIHEVIRVTQDI